ncbi:MAG: hypothetical protein EOP59_12720 [Sphingomonadales bacterium]|nr:MAG: hypothetical protein EOP59_12720 [Sphingomonadales bacterium]
MIGFSRNPNADQLETAGSAQLQRSQNNGAPARVGAVQWQQDNINIGGMCIAFVGTSGQDVQLSGAKMCVLDAQCQQVAGCGQLP